MRDILICGVDDSRVAREAARCARRVAERLGASLVLVHVARVPAVPGASAVPWGRSELRDMARGDGRRLLARVASEAGCAEVEQRVELGDPACGLIRAAEDTEATMLAIGSRGRSALRAALLGSVSLRVCRQAPCPVLVVSPEAPASREMGSLPDPRDERR